MTSHMHGSRTNVRISALVLAWTVLASTLVGTRTASAQTYVSAEPIPSVEMVGGTNLARILGIGYPSLELWSQRLLNDCRIVEKVINVLSDNRAISTVIPANTRYLVAAGGFQGHTNPSYVLTMEDSGPLGVSAVDVYVLNNALGYVLNQSGTAQFSVAYNKQNPFVFSLDYAVVTSGGSLTGEQAKEFFDYVGTIDPALWSGTNAGFTQINASDSPVNNYLMNNSMLFLIGSVPKQQFIEGLFKAASTTQGKTYSPLANNGKPTTTKGGVAFPGNDWLTSPGGEGYLVNLGNPSPQFLNGLAVIRQQHLQAAANLLKAIDKGNLGLYLKNQFKCP